MATHKSAEKRHRQNVKRNERNKAKRSLLKTVVKAVRTEKDKANAEAKLKKAVSVLDKLAQKRVISKNKAANQKSKLTRLVNKLA
ncbi:MAG: 30S ribosomal protein S20 [Ignavibacteria bacterium]|nr:30S ribosomal protein S20 [Ignavibacteria bacterium]